MLDDDQTSILFNKNIILIARKDRHDILVYRSISLE